MSDVQVSTTPTSDVATSNTEKPFNRRPYIIIAVIFLFIIVAWVIILYVMYYSSSGIFGGDSERPPPVDNPDLVPVNGEVIPLTPEEQARLQAKVQEALNNTSTV